MASYIYSYDNANQLLSGSSSYTGLTGAKTVSYTYDADGNRASLTYPDNFVVSTSYTARNQIKEITAGGPPPLATYSYDLNGNRLTKTLENGTIATNSYDSASRLTQLKHTVGSTTLAQFDYTLNSVNNRTQKAVSGTIPNRTETYGYDAVDQVTNVSYGTSRTESFVYDPVGNRTQSTDSVSGTTSYSANALNQYTMIGANTPIYDSKGNLTSIIGNWTYSYDSKNRLISALSSLNPQLSTTFAYDYRNRCVARTVGTTSSITTYYIYDNWNLIGEYNSTGTLQQKYIHGATIEEPLARIDASGTVYYHQDALGSTIALTNVTGSVVESYQYDVFGKVSVRNASGTSIAITAYNNRFLYTGREWLADLGIYDYRNRQYSPVLGRFLQTDPIRFDAGDVNLYRYVANDATNAEDPLGLMTEAECKSNFDKKQAELMAKQVKAGLKGVALGIISTFGGIIGTAIWKNAWPLVIGDLLAIKDYIDVRNTFDALKKDAEQAQKDYDECREKCSI